VVSHAREIPLHYHTDVLIVKQIKKRILLETVGCHTGQRRMEVSLYIG
jgi:5-keto 4-deoxyuronate isomerase